MAAVIVWLKQFASNRPDALVTAVAFVAITCIAIWVNRPYFGATTYAGTWEIAALTTTLFSIGGYWWFQMTSCRDFNRTWVFATCQVLLILTGVATFVAMTSVWDEHGVEAWIASKTALAASLWGSSGVTANAVSIRVMLVLAIGLAFALHDWLVWNWCTDPGKSHQARILFLLDDVPIAAALFFLFLFNIICEGAVHTLQYFIAGAVAFQMLVSNVAYHMITFFGLGHESPPAVS